MKKKVIAACGAAVIVAAVVWANLPEAPLPDGARADRVLVTKTQHRLDLMRDGKILKTYRVSLGRGGMAPKQRQGDHLTPEGTYVLDRHNARSRFYRSIHVSYPGAADAARAKRTGFDPGGDIMVHGITNGLGWLGRLQSAIDWTDGCIAVTDSEMDEIWGAVPDGTPIEIKQ